MSARSPTSASKRGRKKKSNKGRKPKKPLSKEEIAAKKNQKNMRETCRRVEINLHYELLYHSLGQNLVYNRAERVQLLRKAIIKMAELKAHVNTLSEQLRASGMTPRKAPHFQLNSSQKLFMLVQRWARNDNGKKCSRAKLKPVGIEIVDDNRDVPITTPADGHTVEDTMGSDDNDHIPFWASWETDTYIVVDQDAFEKACNQAIIAGWDGKLGSKGGRFMSGLPNACGLTIAQSGAHSHSHHNNTNSHSNTYQNNRHDDEDDDDEEDDEDEDVIIHHRHHQHQHHQHHHHRNHNMPLFPPRIDFPEIVAQGLSQSQLHHHSNHSTHSSSDSRSENTSSSTAEPPTKKQKLNNGRSRKRKRGHDDNNQQIPVFNHSNNYNIPPAQQFVQHSLPLSVPFPAVNGPSALVVGAMQSQMSNASPFMNMRMNNNNTPDHVNQSSSDTGSQQSYNNNNNNHGRNNSNKQQNINVNMNSYVKSEPVTENNTPQPPQFPVQVSFPQFLTFPPHPPQHQFAPQTHSNGVTQQQQQQNNSNSNNLVPVMTFPMFRHPMLANNQPNNAIINNVTPQPHDSNNSTPNPDTKEGIINDNNHKNDDGVPKLPPISSINLPPLPSNRRNKLGDMEGICSSIPTTTPLSPNKAKNNDIDEKMNGDDDDSNTEENDSTPPPQNRRNHHLQHHHGLSSHGDLSPSGSRTSHETRNSIVFTPANHSKNSSAISTDSNTPPSHSSHSHPHKSSGSRSPRPRPEKSGIHLPDNTTTAYLNRSNRSVATTPSIDNYVNQLNWNNNNSTTSTPQGNIVMHSDDYNIVSDVSYDVIPTHPIGIMSGFQDASTSTRDDNNGLKGSAFY